MKPAFILTLLLALVCAPGRPAAFAARPPNIIVVMPDDAGYGDFACLGNPVIKTPALDAFWKQSVRFTDFHVSPTCAPTRAALLTGRHEFRNGVTHTIHERERLAPDAVTLAQVLKSAGYATGIFGKWHLGDEPERWPAKRGFDEMFIHGGGGIGQTFPGSCGDAPGNTYFDPAILHNGAFVKTRGYCTDLFFSRAIEWMDDQIDAHVPFFACITPNAPHAPLQCPDEYFARHRGRVPDDVAKFFGMIENIDDNFARLLAKLDEWGIAEHTLVIFLTDNGGTVGTKIFNAGMRGQKVTPYQGGTRVPSFWRWPARWNGGRDVAALTAHLDVLPTLAEVAGAVLDEKTQRQIEGRSLVPLLTNPAAGWPDRTLVTHVGRWPRGKAADFKYRGCSIRDARFTLVNNAELYDLQNDPGESKDISAEQPAVVEKLRAIYDRWWSGVQPMLVNEDAVGPKVNPMKALFWRQFGGGPDEAMRDAMDPAGLDASLDAVAPGIRKWAAVCVVTPQSDGTPAFAWHDYAESGNATDFWPASAIKIYAAVAALELLNERGFPLDVTVSFEHREKAGAWLLDCARTMREMLSEVFRRSSNEDYTLLLRLVGIDRMNTQFLTPERGFPHSALMRGYVLGRLYGYVREEPQRITLRAADGRAATFEHEWSGRFYAEERGCKIIDARTGNMTSPRELAECLRRVLFAEHLAAEDRYRLTGDQLAFLRHGGAGLTGLETRAPESGPAAWKNGLDAVFPQARFFHKCGVISNYALEVACVDDSAAGGKRFILVPVIAAGEATKPAGGEAIIGEMSRAIGEWVKRR